MPCGEGAEDCPADGDVNCPSSKPLESELDGELAPLLTMPLIATDEFPFTSTLTPFMTTVCRGMLVTPTDSGGTGVAADGGGPGACRFLRSGGTAASFSLLLATDMDAVSAVWWGEE